MDELHIYQTSDMEDYLPKQYYYGPAGRVQAFLDSLSRNLYPAACSQHFDDEWHRNLLQMLNVARNMSLCSMRKNLVIRKMNWYVEKIIELISENKCNYDGYCIFLNVAAWFTENIEKTIKIEVTDCDDNEYKKTYQLDYRQFIKEPNYLKRDYSDKLLAYTCNLLELYDSYIYKSWDYIMINTYMQGDKCFGGRGFVDWS